jgi:cyclopropane fatty-acyl-phospholipid synthase-like methyltransferase
MSMDWSKVRDGRAKAYQIMRPLAQAPLIAGAETLIQRFLKPGDSVLDVGAHDRRIERYLSQLGKPSSYKSLDIDRSFKHDYYAFEDIAERFDLVTVLDVVEHISPETINQMLIACHAVLKPGGRVIVTTPNVSHPVRLWRDCTHITPMHHAELGGFLISAGFTEPSLHRIREMSIKDWLLLPLVWPAIKFLEIDYAFGIAVTAKRSN